MGGGAQGASERPRGRGDAAGAGTRSFGRVWNRLKNKLLKRNLFKKREVRVRGGKKLGKGIRTCGRSRHIGVCQTPCVHGP